MLTLGEVLPGVVDDAVRAERLDQVDVPRAADAGDLRSERLGDLHGERPDATGGAVDQDFLSRLNLPLVAKRLEGGDRRDWHGRSLFEGQVAGHRCH